MTVTTLTACASCGSGDLNPFLDLGTSPIAGDFPVLPESAEKVARYPLRLAFCGACGLAQLLDIIDNKLLYGRDYPYFSGVSQPVVDHMAAYAARVKRFDRLLSRYGIVEIACNDGTFLRHFAEGVDARYVLGIEPAEGPALAAIDRGLSVVALPFTHQAASMIVEDHGPAGVVVGNNVLAHVSDLDDFLAGVKHLLHPDGVAVFEVQYLPDLLTGNLFDLVYHEHHYFWSLTALDTAFKRHDMIIYEVEEHAMQGGSIRFYVSHSGSRMFAENTVRDMFRVERNALTPAAFDSLQARANRIRTRLWWLLENERAAYRTVAAYGASAKATTLFAFTGITDLRVKYVTDTTPMKWGRYMPGTDIPITRPDGLTGAQLKAGGIQFEPPDTYLLTVPNYLGATLRREHDFLDRGGRFIVPLPVPVVI